MKPQATKEYAEHLVSFYYELTEKESTHFFRVGIFEGYEYIAKGKSIIQVLATPALNKNQQKELIKIIKEL
jgi:hypothetical protein